jgi:hypothetical protein
MVFYGNPVIMGDLWVIFYGNLVLGNLWVIFNGNSIMGDQEEENGGFISLFSFSFSF